MCPCSVPSPRGAMGWSVLWNYGISWWPYPRALCLIQCVIWSVPLFFANDISTCTFDLDINHIITAAVNWRRVCYKFWFRNHGVIIFHKMFILDIKPNVFKIIGGVACKSLADFNISKTDSNYFPIKYRPIVRNPDFVGCLDQQRLCAQSGQCLWNSPS